MRYLNWDVLLFPGHSRIPIQEFDTKCHTLPDQSDRFIDYAVLASPCLSRTDPTACCPLLTSFVPSLEHGTPLRVSIHSWEAPEPSHILRALKTRDEVAAYEARLYIDGSMTAQKILGQAAWPEVIEQTDADNIQPKPIRFPPFHPDILDQAHWEAGEYYGRIRVVIAEGVLRHENGLHQAFDRLRDVICFSFQHAPKHILEYSGIAWPNAKLFRSSTRPNLNGSSTGLMLSIPDYDDHAHSPQRKRDQPLPADFLKSSPTAYEPVRAQAQLIPFDDPFVGPVPISLRGQQYHQLREGMNNGQIQETLSTRAPRNFTGTEMSDISYQKVNFEKHMTEAAIEEIVDVLSPQKKQDLLKALTPKRDAFLTLDRGLNMWATTPQSVQAGRTIGVNTPVRATTGLLNHNMNSRPRPLRGNLLASKYAFLPALSAGEHADDNRVTPDDASNLLIILQGSTSKTVEGNSDTLDTLSERSRSFSNASKRKRRDSLVDSTPRGFGDGPTMSTSPCKRDSSGLPYLSTTTSGDEGASLHKRD